MTVQMFEGAFRSNVVHIPKLDILKIHQCIFKKFCSVRDERPDHFLSRRGVSRGGRARLLSLAARRYWPLRRTIKEGGIERIGLTKSGDCCASACLGLFIRSDAFMPRKRVRLKERSMHAQSRHIFRSPKSSVRISPLSWEKESESERKGGRRRQKPITRPPPPPPPKEEKSIDRRSKAQLAVRVLS